MTEQKLWLSIVSVVKDDPDGLARTIDSINEQNLPSVEVIVVDSSSPPMELHVDSSSTNLQIRFVWVEPSGVYPAMNKGLQEAKGEYIYFLNAGDTFMDSAVLTDIRGIVVEVNPDWIVGLVEIEGKSGRRVTSSKWDFDSELERLFARGVFPPHQATFTKTSLLRRLGGFDVSYRIAADYAAALKLSSQAKPEMADRVIASFQEGGLSTKEWKESFNEFHRARREVFSPKGLTSVLEYWNYRKHFLTVLIVRTLKSKGVRS
jgi:glycosyltransferase involved in cell wall biosynthesis